LDIDRKTSTNIKYYVAMMYAIAITRSKTEIAAKLTGMAQLVINTDDLTATTMKVKSMFEEAGGTDQVAKGSAFAEILLAEASNQLGTAT
jgi:hypothetical protein